MTLIITFGNCDFITQLSDRRLIADGKIVEYESNKAGALFCADGRLAFGFTGLAKSFEFETSQWLLKSLHECAPPDYTARETLERFTEKATKDFYTIPALVKTQKKDKRLSIIFSGFLHRHVPPLAVYAVITNFQNFDNNPPAEARDFFTATYWGEKRPNQGDFTLVLRVGFWPAFNEKDVEQIRSLLKKRLPPKAVLAKAIKTMNEVSDRPIAREVIGKELSSITIPRDDTKNINSGYHPQNRKHLTIIPDVVFAQSPNSRLAIANMKLEAVDPKTTPPLVFPRVPRKHPCPCGSGKRYKHCHGKLVK